MNFPPANRREHRIASLRVTPDCQPQARARARTHAASLSLSLPLSQPPGSLHPAAAGFLSFSLFLARTRPSPQATGVVNLFTSRTRARNGPSYTRATHLPTLVCIGATFESATTRVRFFFVLFLRSFAISPSFSRLLLSLDPFDYLPAYGHARLGQWRARHALLLFALQKMPRRLPPPLRCQTERESKGL